MVLLFQNVRIFSHLTFLQGPNLLFLLLKKICLDLVLYVVEGLSHLANSGHLCHYRTNALLMVIFEFLMLDLWQIITLSRKVC